MALKDITSRDAILQAIRECDRIGREQFLARYGFGEAHRYFLVLDGQRYDSKAIVGVAHGYQFPAQGPLRSPAFSGGNLTVQRKLEELGFTVEVEPNPSVCGTPRSGTATNDSLIVTAATPGNEKCPGHRARSAGTALARILETVRAIERDCNQRVELLALPAGYFALDCYSPNALKELSAAVFAAGATPAIATLVDASDVGAALKHLKPSFGVVMHGGSIVGSPVQKTSWTGVEGRAVRPEDAQGELRVHQVGRIKMGLLCCGEVFSPVVKDAIIQRGPSVVINASHRPIEVQDGIRDTWCRYLRSLSARISGWSLHAGPATDPEAAEYTYYNGKPATAEHRFRVAGGGTVLRCFRVRDSR
jgi:hypothetical protein